MSPLTVFDTDVTKASEGGCSEVAVVFGATLFGCSGHREPLSRAAAVLVWAPAHHGARSRRADPIATRPHPAPPAIPASPLPPHPLALWRFGAPPSASAHPVQPWCTGSKSSLVFWSSVLPDAVLHMPSPIELHIAHALPCTPVRPQRLPCELTHAPQPKTSADSGPKAKNDLRNRPPLSPSQSSRP